MRNSQAKRRAFQAAVPLHGTALRPPLIILLVAPSLNQQFSNQFSSQQILSLADNPSERRPPHRHRFVQLPTRAYPHPRIRRQHTKRPLLKHLLTTSPLITERFISHPFPKR